MKTVIIGSGNVAYHLAKALLGSGVPLVQIFGRNTEQLRSISYETGVPFSTETLSDADLYIISVRDSTIGEVSRKISNPYSLVVHTSGSIPLDALEGNYHKGVLYPLQTFSKSKPLDYKKIPFFIETQFPEDRVILKNFIKNISPKIMYADSTQRQYIHITAVFVCNFVNHLFAKGKEIADREDIPFEYFLPLIEETVEKIKEVTPKQAQTGPAVRNDKNILVRQENLIQDEMALAIYKIMNQSIQKMYEL
ncbi:Rossmann-like and DUF2520 domain-containing protein [Riemerella columbipharyngis]|uniref:Predicted oxidoreductase, contains short-chain dehydrogenase (SDR) and DUF2520 domains n=1 Tax=Riemerella columbipharyngis TaxID=1071918 RepID=A0A1G7DI00_9FLAO|nr:Rossmann-like and DUF2520 domain-containing protein [Riemerella columbipharyngis]SDE51167.1 Predicted oxidoreductase, contains short-chain dehydrogenase (SDR) and DUF2520 domains [Riemerella columbipharyngis]